MMNELTGKSGKKYIISKKLNSGGEGTAYAIKGDPKRIIKIFNSGSREKQDKIEKMVLSDLKNSPDVAFPEDVIYEKGRFIGYVMKFAEGEPISIAYNNSKSNKTTLSERFTIAKNICIALDNIHQEGYVFGDFNANNVLFNPRTGTVTLIDTDSFIFESYGGIVARPEIVPKEIREAMGKNENYPDEEKKPLPFSKETDYYTLAVHIFQLLMNGEHPFVFMATREMANKPMYAYELDEPTFPYLENKYGINPPMHAIPLESLPMELQTLFVRSFKEGYSDPMMRVSPREFLEAINDYEKSCGKCSKGHPYYNMLSKCPYCEADERLVLAISGRKPDPVEVSRQTYVYSIDYEEILNHKEKFGLLSKAAKSGKASACLTMGRLYSDGLIVEQDDREAFQYFKKASESSKPEPEAQYRLALCYLDGIGTEPSKDEAKRWLLESSKRNYEYAMDILDYIDMVEIRKEVNLNSKTSTLFKKDDVIKTEENLKTDEKKDLKTIYKEIKQKTPGWRETLQIIKRCEKEADESPENSFYFAEILAYLQPRSKDRYTQYYEKAANKRYVPAIVRLAELNLDKPTVALQYYRQAKLLDNSVVIPEYLIPKNTKSDSKAGAIDESNGAIKQEKKQEKSVGPVNPGADVRRKKLKLFETYELVRQNKADKFDILLGLEDLLSDVKAEKTGYSFYCYAAILEYINKDDCERYYERAAKMDYVPAIVEVMKRSCPYDMPKALDYLYMGRLKDIFKIIPQNMRKAILDCKWGNNPVVTWAGKKVLTITEKDEKEIFNKLIMDIGNIYFDDKNYTSALECFKIAGENGDTSGMFNAAMMYKKSTYGKHDRDMFMVWADRYTRATGRTIVGEEDEKKPKRSFFGNLFKKRKRSTDLYRENELRDVRIDDHLLVMPNRFAYGLLSVAEYHLHQRIGILGRRDLENERLLSQQQTAGDGPDVGRLRIVDQISPVIVAIVISSAPYR